VLCRIHIVVLYYKLVLTGFVTMLLTYCIHTVFLLLAMLSLTQGYYRKGIIYVKKDDDYHLAKVHVGVQQMIHYNVSLSHSR